MNNIECAHLAIVDDDIEIRNSLKTFFTQYHYKVSIVSSGPALMTLLERETVDLIISDVVMPAMDGFELCRQIRNKTNTPIILLTAMLQSTECIIGLEVGADDYVTKPFNPRELLARVKTILRRAYGPMHVNNNIERHYHFAGWILSKATRHLTSPTGIIVDLTSGEYNLLIMFLTHPQRVLNRDQLLDSTKGYGAEIFSRSIDIQISRLRHKIESDPKNPLLIITVRNGGYMFSVNVTVK